MTVTKQCLCNVRSFKYRPHLPCHDNRDHISCQLQHTQCEARAGTEEALSKRLLHEGVNEKQSLPHQFRNSPSELAKAKWQPTPACQILSFTDGK